MSAILAFPSACSDAQNDVSAETSGVTERDSAGVAILENHAPAWDPGEEWTVALEPSLQIGALDGEEPYLFTTIHRARTLADGSIAIVDRSTGEVRVFDPDGAHRITVGRRGEGPGEFTNAPEVAPGLGDTLLIAWDERNYRQTWFGPAGDVLSELPLAQLVREPTGLVMSFGQPWQVGQSGDLLLRRRMVGTAQRFASHDDGIWDPNPVGVRDEPTEFTLVTRADGSVRPLGSFPGAEGVGVETRSAVVMVLENPFAPSATAILAPGPPAVIRTGAARWELLYLRSDGTIERIVRASIPQTPITPDHIERYRNANWTHPVDGTPLPELADAIDQMTIPDSLPAISSDHVFADPAGYIWVGRRRLSERTSPAPADTYDVIDPDGRWLGTVPVPPDALDVLSISEDHLLARWSDDFGVPYLRLYPIQRPGRPSSGQ